MTSSSVENEQFSIIIRCAHQAFEDERISCPSSWTVLQLKQKVKETYSSKPDPNHQRLIYSGHVLKDKSLLRDCLIRYSDDVNAELILHLVYAPNAEQAQRKFASVASGSAPKQAAFGTADSPSATDASVSSSEQQHGQPQSNPTAPAFTWTAGPAWNMSDSSMAYYAQMQNAYAYYMNNYLAYVNQLYGMTTAAQMMPGGAQQMPMMPFYQQQNVQSYAAHFYGNYAATATADQDETTDGQRIQHPPPVFPQQAQPQPPPVAEQAMNAQGELDAVELQERDWLELVYMGLRGGILLMILWHYSSFVRLSFVLMVVTVIYGYQNGWFGRRMDRPENRDPLLQRPNAQDNNNNLVNNNNNVNNDGLDPAQNEAQGNAADANPADNANAAQQQAQPNADPNNNPPPQPQQQFANMTSWQIFCTVCYTFFTSFFASLIPERPPPVDLN